MDRNINQTHYGSGDNVAGDKNSTSNTKEKDIPLWLKYVVAITGVIGFLYVVGFF